MLDKPNKEEQQAIKSLANSSLSFNKYISYLIRCLELVREANDDLDLNKVQVGQGVAKALKAQIIILKDLTGVK